jgi:NAD-dependent SIR2 family protein deacetylase
LWYDRVHLLKASCSRNSIGPHLLTLGPGVSIPSGSSSLPLSHPFELLVPIIWQVCNTRLYISRKASHISLHSQDQAQSSSVFQTMKHHLKPASKKNLFYQAIHSLDRRGNLLRIYTQNIDAMEKTAGLLSYGVPLAHQIGQPDCPRCIPLLGRLDQMSCSIGPHVVPSVTFLDQSASDGLPRCSDCRPYQCGHHGIRRPNIVVSKEELPNLDAILDHDKNLVDVVLAVGVQPMPYSDLSLLIKQFTQAAWSRTQEGCSSSILIDLDISTLENAGIPELFQISLELDLQDFFKSIISAAYQDARHNPASNTMLVPKKLTTTDFSMRLCDNQEEEDLGQDELLLTLSPWYFSVL